MDAQEIKTLKALMEYEASRTTPPASFPALPDLPGGRYTDPEFMALERAHIWRKSWLLAAHIDELPEPGCFLLWEQADQPVVIVHRETGQIVSYRRMGGRFELLGEVVHGPGFGRLASL